MYTDTLKGNMKLCVTQAQRWIKMRVLHLELYKLLDAEYRKNKRCKIRTRVKNWKRANRERYNAWQRDTYHRLKEELAHGNKSLDESKAKGKSKTKGQEKQVRTKGG